MRRLAALHLLAALPLAALLLAGCAGADAQRAQALLERALRAQDGLTSATFVAEVTVDGEGQSAGVTINGGGYFKGRRAGDMFFRVRTSGIPGAPDGVGVVVEGGRLYVSDGSGWTSMRVPQQGAQPQVEAADVSRAMAALADSVENVSVVEGQAFQGEPATIVNGRLDTAGLLRSLASELQAASGLPGSGLFPLDELTKHLGDVNASLMLSDRTGLLVGAVVTLEITGDQPGQSLRIELIYRVTSTNERVRFPRV